MEQEITQSQPPHIAILSSPGMGHLIPLVELANLLALRHKFTVTLITFTDFSPPSNLFLPSSLPPSISSLSLPSVPLSDLPSDSRMDTRVSALMARSVPSLTLTLQTLKSSTNLVAYVIDLLGVDTLPVAIDLDIPHYMFFTSNLFLLSFVLRMPALYDVTTSCEFRDMKDPLNLPGCVPLRREDFPDPFQDRSDEACTRVVHMMKCFRLLDGILVNTFEAIEPDAAKFLSSKEEGRPPVYCIGPVIRSRSGCGIDRSDCLKWLDQQPNGSVLFVSFGSGGNLSCAQVRELALGLEMSGKRFVWVVRTPSDFGVKADFVWMGSDSDSLDFLPQGFLARTNNLGMVVPNWSPQIEVLSHAAVGGFLTHCGWNSTLESMMKGVPMIAWPLYAEQRMNAVMLVEVLKVAIRPRVGEKGIVEREEICRVVNELMEGGEGVLARRRVKEMQKAGFVALKDKGSSTRGVSEVVERWKRTLVM